VDRRRVARPADRAVRFGFRRRLIAVYVARRRRFFTVDFRRLFAYTVEKQMYLQRAHARVFTHKHTLVPRGRRCGPKCQYWRNVNIANSRHLGRTLADIPEVCPSITIHIYIYYAQSCTSHQSRLLYPYTVLARVSKLPPHIHAHTHRHSARIALLLLLHR